MDGNLVVFQLNVPWLIAGLGPDSTGNNGSFQTPQLITSNVGCRDPGSVCLTPLGLTFKSTQGIYLLSRSLVSSYIGVDMARYNADVISSARLINNNTQVEFLSDAGTPLIYDFFFQSWGTNGNHQGPDSIIGPTGLYTYLNTNGEILVQDDTTWGDNNVGYPMIVETSWLKFDGVNGFHALWKFFLQGTFIGGQQYQIQIAYDEDPTIVDTFLWTPTTTTTTWRIYPSRIHCKALKFIFQDVAPFATNSTPALDSVDFEVGIRKGGYKNIGASRSSG